MIKKKLFINVKVEKTKEARTLRFVGSNEALDRDGDIMTLSGWKIKEYKKNPVILWAHNSRELPIAKTTRLQLSQKDGLVFYGKFPERDEHPFADVVYRLYKGKYLNAFSVGFMILPGGYERDPKGPNKITKKELLEVSAVPVPANPEALQTESIKTALEDGVINEQEYLECGVQSKRFLKLLEEDLPEDEDEIKVGDDIKFDNLTEEEKDAVSESIQESLGVDEDGNPKVIEPKKHECSKCGGPNAYYREIRPDTSSNEIIEVCPDCEKPKEVKKPIAKNVYDDILAIKELKTPEKREPLSTDLMESIKDVIPKKEDK